MLGVSLQDRLHEDLTRAMKARDELRVATLRMALAAVGTEQVAGPRARTLSDEEVLRVLGREAKRRREAAEAYAGAGRPELAEREEAEGRVLADYLPTPLSDAELVELVAAVVGEVTRAGASGPAAMGAVMRAVTPRVAGRAEGGRVAAEVRRQLAG